MPQLDIASYLIQANSLAVLSAFFFVVLSIRLLPRLLRFLQTLKNYILVYLFGNQFSGGSKKIYLSDISFLFTNINLRDYNYKK